MFGRIHDAILLVQIDHGRLDVSVAQHRLDLSNGRAMFQGEGGSSMSERMRRDRADRILTDRGTEYCGAPEHHEYELYLAVENIDHTRTGSTPFPRTVELRVSPPVAAARVVAAAEDYASARCSQRYPLSPRLVSGTAAD